MRVNLLQPPILICGWFYLCQSVWIWQRLDWTDNCGRNWSHLCSAWQIWFVQATRPYFIGKMERMITSYLNNILSQILDTYRLDIGLPPSLAADTLQLLKQFYSKRKMFTVKEMERVNGMIIFITSSAPYCPRCTYPLQLWLAITQPTSPAS